MNKKSRMRLTFCKGDIVVIFACIMLAVLIGVVFVRTTGTDKGGTVVIYQNGNKTQELFVTKDFISHVRYKTKSVYIFI